MLIVVLSLGLAVALIAFALLRQSKPRRDATGSTAGADAALVTSLSVVSIDGGSSVDCGGSGGSCH